MGLVIDRVSARTGGKIMGLDSPGGAAVLIDQVYVLSPRPRL